jgi:ComF family protein
VPLPGEDDMGDVQCDDCMRIARPWSRGYAAMLYRDNARKLVLGLKHGDRTDLAKPSARWMVSMLPDVPQDTLVVPVPLHWLRFLKRRYNQAGLLAREVARQTGLTYLPDALQRPRATKPMDGVSRDSRFVAMESAIVPHPKRSSALQGRRVLLVDDVMTSGATLAAATEACKEAGADHIDVLVLARVAKDT